MTQKRRKDPTAAATTTVSTTCRKIFFFKARNLLFNFIAYPPHRFDVFRMFRRIVHFFTQMPDMHHDGVVAARKVFFSPDLVEQLLRADDPAPVRAQEPKDRELGGGQGERLFVKGALVGILIEHQAGERDDPLLGFAFGAGCIGWSAQLRLTRAIISSGRKGLVM